MDDPHKTYRGDSHERQGQRGANAREFDNNHVMYTVSENTLRPRSFATSSLRSGLFRLTKRSELFCFWLSHLWHDGVIHSVVTSQRSGALFFAPYGDLMRCPTLSASMLSCVEREELCFQLLTPHLPTIDTRAMHTPKRPTHTPYNTFAAARISG